ncbi:hypothetical protein EGW08_012666 [Elysia chlorotica]|uniref:PDZ domain-containing protein n=1 Tax=Elysia chlorotica TaxID=188477 RepID=A0A433TDA0_ELYCH|nr:hypothetical protein EGW08_012666 [Elysia chlorotica]
MLPKPNAPTKPSTDSLRKSVPVPDSSYIQDWSDGQFCNEAAPAHPQSLTLPSRKVIRSPNSNVSHSKSSAFASQSSHPDKRQEKYYASDKINSHETEFSESKHVFPEPSTLVMQTSTVMSSPKSSAMVKMNVKPLETHVAQSSPVMQSFKPSNNTNVSQQSPQSKKPLKFPTTDSLGGDYQQISSPSLQHRPPQGNNSCRPQQSVDRVDQQLHENRKQIDVSSPVIGSRRNGNNNLMDTSKNGPGTSNVSTTLPRQQHQPRQSITSGTKPFPLHIDTTDATKKTEKSTTQNDNTKRAMVPPVQRTFSEDILSPGCYSSLPRGRHQQRGTSRHFPLDNHLHGFQVYDPMHIEVKDDQFLAHKPPSKLPPSNAHFQDVVKVSHTAPSSENNVAMTFFQHNQDFARLAASPTPLHQMNKGTTFSTFGSPHQNINSAYEPAPSTSFKSYSQSSFHRYYSDEAKSTFETNTSESTRTLRCDGSAGYDNAQEFTTGISSKTSISSSLPSSGGMFASLKMPQMMPMQGMAISSSHHSNSSAVMASNHKPHGRQLVNKCRFDVLLTKESGVSLGINIVRKTVAGTTEVYVQDIMPGTTADRDKRLRRGDTLITVNGLHINDLTLLDAHQMFHSLAPGPVKIQAARDMGCG